MEAILVKTAQLLLSLSILVILHEFGHFLFARLFKTRVEKFYLFFNPWFSLFKVKKGETEYGIGWLPLGGYVKIAGMIDESMDKEAMKQPPKPYEFRAKPAWKRLLIMLGGVLMNFIFALLIYIGISWTWGETYLPTSEVKYGIVAEEAGEKIGLQTGDKILSVGGEYIENFDKIIPTLLLEDLQSIQIERNGKQIDLKITDSDIAVLLKSKAVMSPRYLFDIQISRIVKDSPAQKAGLRKGDKIVSVDDRVFTYYDQFSEYLETRKGQTARVEILREGNSLTLPVDITPEGKIGFYQTLNESAGFKLRTIKYGFLESFPAGIRRGVEITQNYLKQFKLFFKPETKAYESLGGFITIGSIFPGYWDWQSFWTMTAFISIILAIMNLLPIPALDGGHVLFTLYEMISGRKPNEKFLEYAQIAGMILLLILVFYANANDIIKLFR